ncbi:MAG TPA: hypothetical protein VFN67_32930 [Polyangiales bacterium]|nr:hypothetical protein [Polyangiales bacterium]
MEASWSAGLAVLQRIALPEHYQLDQMTSLDVRVVTARLAQWYPAIQAGMESPHLQPEFFLSETQLADQTQNRSLLPIVIRKRDEGIVAIITYERNVLARSITCRLGVLAPEHRSAHLALLGPLLLEEIGRALGAELAYYFATLKTRHQQVIAERRGFQLVGIVPGYDRDVITDGVVKRVYEALYAKLLVPSDELYIPPPESFTKRTRAVGSTLFEQD